MPNQSVKKLDESQLKNFDWEFVDEPKKAVIQQLIDTQIGRDDFRFIDIGGGNGKFADWVLSQYPKSTGVVLDNSSSLLKQNIADERKRLVLGSATELQKYVEGKFDVVFMNFVLHHLVTNGYRKTRQLQVDVLKSASSVLADAGRISILENIYDGAIVRGLPSFLIFRLTSLRIIAPIIRKLGASTAGVGVCFLSRKQWLSSLDSASLKSINYIDHAAFRISLLKRVVLHLGNIRGGHFWCSKAQIS